MAGTRLSALAWGIQLKGSIGLGALWWLSTAIRTGLDLDPVIKSTRITASCCVRYSRREVARRIMRSERSRQRGGRWVDRGCCQGGFETI